MKFEPTNRKSFLYSLLVVAIAAFGFSGCSFDKEATNLCVKVVSKSNVPLRDAYVKFYVDTPGRARPDGITLLKEGLTDEAGSICNSYENGIVTNIDIEYDTVVDGEFYKASLKTFVILNPGQSVNKTYVLEEIP